jgi:hypothetical protein
MRHGGGKPFPSDRTTEPLLSRDDLKIVANLSYPPGNIAVSRKTNRIFFSFHPEGKAPYGVAELVEEDGKVFPKPFPNQDTQKEFDSVLAMRIEELKDGREILWTLDFAHHALFGGKPRIMGFDISSAESKLVHDYYIPSEIAGFGSMMNDFHIHEGKLYIADASIFAKTPALIIYNPETKTASRKLNSHHSVIAKPYDTHIEHLDIDMVILGVFGIRPGVDSIAIDSNGEWLYYAAVTDPLIYRVRLSDLDNNKLTATELGKRVQTYANKTMSDGIIADEKYIYLTDMEHSAILRLSLAEDEKERKLETLFKLPGVLRWPDGLSMGKDGWIYATCSSLENVIFKTNSHMESQSPYHIFRFQSKQL